MLAIHPKALVRYMPEPEKERAGENGSEPEAVIMPTFLLRNIPAWEFADLSDRVSKMRIPGKDDGDDTGPIMRDVLRRGLRGWENFKFADGSDAPFQADSDGVPTDETLGALDYLSSIMLMNQIMNVNRVGARRKN